MNDLISLGGIGLLAAFLSLTIRSISPPISRLLSTMGLALFLTMAVGKLSSLVSIAESIGVPETIDVFIEPLIKALGIGTVTKITADVCRDCGEEALAGGAELLGKAEILLLCLQPAKELLSTVQALLPD